MTIEGLTTKTAHFIGHSNLMDYLNTKFEGGDIQIVESEPDDMFEQDEADKIVRTGSCEAWNLCTLMEDAVLKGFIDRGVYVVRVCW
jgi:hypothetical protein